MTIRGCPQFEFLTSEAETTAYFGANRCLGGETEIFDPVLSQMKRVDEISGDFHVYAWDGEKKIIALAEKPFQKEVDDLYELTLSNGQKFVCSMSHIVLTSYGYRTIADVLQEYGGVLRASISDTFLRAHVAGVRSSLKRVLGSPSDYLVYPYFCDEQLREDQGIDLDDVPLLDDVLEHTCCAVSGHEDGREYKEERSRLYRLCGRPSIRDGRGHPEDQCVGTLSRVSYRPSLSAVAWNESVQRSKLGSFPERSTDGFYQPDTQLCSTTASDTSYLAITSIVYKRRDVKWDFTVPEYHNYECGGVFHHNSGKTTAAVIKSIYHATGRYPDWWTGRKYDRPTIGRIFAKDFQKGAQVVIKKLHQWMPRDAFYTHPRKGTMGIETMWQINHAPSGGVSYFDIMTYEQDPSSAEGWDGDWVMFDEPPPRDLYIAAVRGLVDNDGLCWFSLTPLKEPWLFDEIYCSKNANVFSVVCDLRHNLERMNPLSGEMVGLKEESIRKFEQKLTEEERETRIHGKFRYLAGRIWKDWDRDVHTFDRMKEWPMDRKKGILFAGQPPAHWPRAMFLDPHDRRPQALLWVACDDTGDYWVYREAWMVEALLPDVAVLCKRVEMENRERIRVRILDPNFGPKRYGNTGQTVRDEIEKAAKDIQYPMRFVFGDDRKEAGRKAVAELLRFDRTRPLSFANHPKLHVANDLKETIYQVEHYIWDDYKLSGERDPKEKPKDINTHMPDLLHYLALSKFQMYKPELIEGHGNFYSGSN